MDNPYKSIFFLKAKVNRFYRFGGNFKNITKLYKCGLMHFGLNKKRG